MSTDPASSPVPVPNAPKNGPITIDPSAVSKKRSHREMSPDDDTMAGLLPPSRTPGISPTNIHGADIPRINPLTGTATEAEEVSGSWLEHELEERLGKGRATDSESESPKRKVPRRENASDADVAEASNATESSRATVADPSIDQYTRLLGIGWTYEGEQSSFVAMARGYARYINNHYPLADIEILLKSKSLEAYLVKSNQGYFLFQEDLTTCRLVAVSWEETVANLQCSPPRFSSEQPLCAAESSGTGRETDNSATLAAIAGEALDMELD